MISEKTDRPKTILTWLRPPMKHWRIMLAILLVLAIIAAGVLYKERHQIHYLLTNSHPVGGQTGIANLHLPPGFHASVFATGLSEPRLITFGPHGTLFVAERTAGDVVALLDPHHHGKATTKIVVVKGLDELNSVVFHKGILFV